MSKGIPRFVMDSTIGHCSPVTEYTAKKDGSFIARCHSIPGFAVCGATFDETVAKATELYRQFTMKGIWN